MRDILKGVGKENNKLLQEEAEYQRLQLSKDGLYCTLMDTSIVGLAVFNTEMKAIAKKRRDEGRLADEDLVSLIEIQKQVDSTADKIATVAKKVVEAKIKLVELESKLEKSSIKEAEYVVEDDGNVSFVDLDDG